MSGCVKLLQKLVVAIIISVFCGVSIAQIGHGPPHLTCFQCHTMHYSEGGKMPIGVEDGGPFPRLLLTSTTTALCLICHGGSSANAPDVVYPMTYSSNLAGGYFANSGGIASDNAHNLGMPSGEIPPGGSDNLILSCASCHNPHGNSNYRNLLFNPAGSGNSADVNVIVSQAKSADGSGGNSSADVYLPSNILYRSGMSDWCRDCHPNFHGASGTNSSGPWFRHPQDVSVYGKAHADYTRWNRRITNRVEVESSNDTVVPGADDEVFCLSCHKAHGSAHKSSLVYADGARMLSTCQQCHNQTYESTKHGNATDGVERISGISRGECAHCHDEHASRDGAPTPGGPYDYLLFKENDNNLCYTNDGAGTCHASAGANGIYQGSTVYDDSSHATSMNAYWPGPTPPSRPSSDYGKCLNCHTPHGSEDTSGLIPGQTLLREEDLCATCHDGSLANEITKIYRHPTGDYSGKHSQSEEGTAINYGSSNRHAECVDCHNPHYAKSDAMITPSAPVVANRNKGVSGVRVINGGAGNQPSYTHIPPDVGINYEYQLCFKCHSSWTTQPGGQSDMAVLFNPNNPSYHPVEAQGKNTHINPGAFVNGCTSTDTIYCTDCHASDNTLVRGPHGSQYNHILKKNYVARSNKRYQPMSPDELCFDCHNYETYANEQASDEVKKYSRFYKHGHEKHVSEEKYPCYACHDSHASTDEPHLIVTGRAPGIISYAEAGPTTQDKGTCYPTCHEEKDYQIEYDR